MKKIIGIDLGTTNSLVTVWKDGKAELIPNAFGEFLTPSVVSFGEDEVLYVGKAAKERLVTHPNSTFEFFKRNMGHVTQYGKYTPEELSSFVLRSLKEDAEKYLGESVEEAVISVPAYFDDKARNATKNAGLLAGLKVERIINEPSAAALGYIRANGQKEGDLYDDRCLLIFDFGGGTLDVSMVETFENVVEIVSVSGDNMLGGIDFDRAIALHFLKENGKEEKDVSPSAFNVILDSAEAVKRELSDANSAVMHVYTNEIQGDLEITAKELVEICSSVLKRLYRPIKEVLNNSQKELDEITDVVMVGGSSKMPIVKRYLQKILERDEIYVSNPDCMVALGMGVYAGIKERDEDIKNVILTDVCPFSMGVTTINKVNRDLDLTSFIIPRNTALPVSRRERYCTTYPGQEKILVQICQGENRYAKGNRNIGEIRIEFPHAIDIIDVWITFTYDINGILIVDVEIPAFDINRREVIVDESINLTEDMIEGKVKELDKLKMISQDEQEDYQLIEWASRLFEQYNGGAREELARRMDFFMYQKETEKDMYQIMRIRNHFKRFLLAYQMNLNQFHFEDKDLDNSWMDSEDKMIEEIYKDWEPDND